MMWQVSLAFAFERQKTVRRDGSPLEAVLVKCLLRRSGNFVLSHEQFLCKRDQKSESGKTLRMLAVQELLQLLEGPKEEKCTTVVRGRGSALTDGRIGWMTLNKQSLKAWTSTYQCTQATPITENVVATSRALRQLQAGEVIEMLDGPRG